jgi:hypothetical protein
MATVFNIQDDQLEIRFQLERNDFLNVKLASVLVLIFLVFANVPTYSKVLFGVIALYFFFSDVIFTRTLTVFIAARESLITIKTGGILDSKVSENTVTFRFDEVANIEMVHVRKPKPLIDTFTLRLARKDSRRSVLVAKDLTFQDCQKYSSEIQKFVGTHIPIVAVD